MQITQCKDGLGVNECSHCFSACLYEANQPRLIPYFLLTLPLCALCEKAGQPGFAVIPVARVEISGKRASPVNRASPASRAGK